MKYLLLLYVDPAREPAPDHPDFTPYVEGHFAVSRQMVADGTFIAGEGLHGVETATCLRVRGGKVETMDGPFAETREHLGGFYLIDAPDLDSALRYVPHIPSAHLGTVEVRPVIEYHGIPGSA